MEKIRKASHSGSWYTNQKSELINQLSSFISSCVKHEKNNYLKSIIVPHAGYRYSAKTASWAYANINPELYNRIVILGPSHKVYITGCCLTSCTVYETPIGNIKIDLESVERLSKLNDYYIYDKNVEENEHSLEMQLPFLKLIFGDKDFKLLPIMVGQTSIEQDFYFADTLKELYEDKETLFVISSDFCHWGKRFNYMYLNKDFNKIYQSIEYIDKLGIECIESLDPYKFNDYLVEFKNTICGRRPISILLCLIQNFKNGFINFIKYDQSSQVEEMDDSSVSYAAGLNIIYN